MVYRSKPVGGKSHKFSFQDSKRLKSLPMKLDKSKSKSVPVPSPTKGTSQPFYSWQPEQESSIDHMDGMEQPKKGSKSQNDFLREFVPKQHKYLEVLLQAEAPNVGENCSLGCGKAMSWRCTSCLGRPQYCVNCLRKSHTRLPFHTIERWCGPGTFFRTSSLRYSGTKIFLGHGGIPCPDASVSESFEDATPKPGEGEPHKKQRQAKEGLAGFDEVIAELEKENLEDEDEDEEDWVDETESTCEELEDTPDDPSASHHRDTNGNPILTIVDVTGVHRLPFVLCQCRDAKPMDIQLVQMGFIPSSYEHIRTVFTTHVLDDFLQDNQEANTSGYTYFEKLRRRTSSAFPDRTPNRYREMLRISRQWRLFKYRKWHQFSHSGCEPGNGELALFCPSCPQAGINIPEDWVDDENQYLYMRSYVADGNFTASHLKQKKPLDDVRLTDGTGMRTARTPYQNHLKVAYDDKDINDCNATRALNIKVTKAGTTATGIGAAACARHGCFVPCSCVDFQKGERQANIDYVFFQALKYSNLDIRQIVLLIYDAICQLCKKMKLRWDRNTYLEWPENPKIYNAIGSFHVRGHVAPCFQRYGLLFIPGAGLIDGEVIETLWSKLNHVSPSTRGASEAHRDEIIDDQMNHSNWKKTVRMPQSICRKYKRALKLQKEADEAFTRLDGKISEDQRETWSERSESAQKTRFHNVKSMDWFSPNVGKDPGREAIELELLEKQKKAKSKLKGVASTLSEALALEEAQLHLRQHIAALGDNPTRKQRIEVFRRRNTLEKKVDTINLKLTPFFAAGLDSDSESGWVDDKEPEAEHRILLLPSSVGIVKCTTAILKELVKMEIRLRAGQASDCLEHIRLELGRKAFLHVKKRSNPIKRVRTRGWAAIHATEDKISEHTAVYRRVRSILASLKAPPAMLKKFQELTDSDLNISTTLLDTQVATQRHKTLPWIWGAETGKGVLGDSWSQEFKRSHWLRANEQLKRANEEVLLLQHEMTWTSNFFRWKAASWDSYSEDTKLTEGHQCYARRQSAMWLEMAENADDTFQACLAKLAKKNN